ncbi:MAG: hypothetical protein JSR54_02370 [Proteobacteria bacterium]|nr:hypothetical protein [Pseudomonadota bacterium]
MNSRTAIALVVALIASSPAMAGPYSDDLGKCLVAATTPDDRLALARWMFVAFSAHPGVAALSNVKAADVDGANAQIAGLFTKLMTEDCAEKTKAAIRFEGPSAIELGFQILGEVAGRELATSAEVQARIAGLTKFVDGKKFEAFGQGAAK